MQHYSEEFKLSIIKKSLVPGGPSIARFARENGLVPTTVYGWRKKYANEFDMKTSNKLTPEKKLLIIIETASLPEHELGEYIRKNGLHSTDINEWKNECKAAMSGAGRPKIAPEVVDLRKDKKTLEKDLKRKNMALAEMSARVILLKKKNVLFGDPEEDE